ncbi:hypothetical protein GGF43_003995 [Coemansia sp. RSA 2618]|nr:hypothetical protein GGF43_003995 [Coemansia sp. RSA 2618]
MLHHRLAHHGHCGNFKGKLVLAGVALWLTSTVIAGVRRSTGWTHNAYGLPAPITTTSTGDSEDHAWQSLMNARVQTPRDYVEYRRLEQQYVDSAPSPETREMREQRLGSHYHMYRNGMYEHRQCRSGGLAMWYLGVGERTFDWAVRKISASHRFHREEPGMSYGELKDARSHQRAFGHPGFQNHPAFYSHPAFFSHQHYAGLPATVPPTTVQNSNIQNANQ